MKLSPRGSALAVLGCLLLTGLARGADRGARPSVLWDTRNDNCPYSGSYGDPRAAANDPAFALSRPRRSDRLRPAGVPLAPVQALGRDLKLPGSRHPHSEHLLNLK